MVWIGTRLGLATQHVIELATLPFIAAFAVTAVLVYRLALRWSSDENAATAACALFAFHWIPLGFGSTVYPRTIATLCVTAAAYLAERSRAASFAAGCLLGIAFADRYSEIVFLIPLLFIARSRLAMCVGAIVSIAITCGVYDWITWGSPFSSLIKFTEVTLLQPDFSSRLKYQPPWWYVANVSRWLALTLLPLLWFSRRSRALLFVGVPLLAFSLVQHKELRYLHGVIPFVAVAAAIGFAKMPRRRLAVALAALSLIWNAAGLSTFRKKSQPAVLAARAIATLASTRNLAVSQLWAFGDRFYLGRRVNIDDIGTPPRLTSLEKWDTVAVYESDIGTEQVAAIEGAGFKRRWRFDDGPARAVVVYTRLSP
jgi:hypothetical protein